MACNAEYNKQRHKDTYVDNREEVIRRTKEYYIKNKEAAKKHKATWYAKNRDTQALSRKEWKLLNKPLVRAYTAKRRSAKLNATPSWLTEQQHEAIRDFYWLAIDLERVSGESYHVDHIVPLQGKLVCGLHVPWNLQILPATINASKGNTYEY